MSKEQSVILRKNDWQPVQLPKALIGKMKRYGKKHVPSLSLRQCIELAWKVFENEAKVTK